MHCREITLATATDYGGVVVIVTGLWPVADRTGLHCGNAAFKRQFGNNTNPVLYQQSYQGFLKSICFKFGDTTPKMIPTPPPPPPPAFANAAPTPKAQPRPSVAEARRSGAFLVELFVFNAFPYKDHWAYWVSAGRDSTRGNYIHAFGDVRNGFTFEIRRSHDCSDPSDQPTTRIPLQWVANKYFNETAMLNKGGTIIEGVPRCEFEKRLHAVKVPEKSLNVVVEKVRDI